METLNRLSVESFLNQLSDRTPTPGGGSVAALAGALSCAMGRMVAAYSVTKKTGDDKRSDIEAVASKLRRADELLRALMDKDVAAYQAMVKSAKTKDKGGADSSEHQAAVLNAIAVPMQMTAIASNALEILDDFATSASRYLISDLGVSAVLAEAAARAARYSVVVNLGELSDDGARGRILQEIDSIVEHCTRRLRSIEEFVSSQLEH